MTTLWNAFFYVCMYSLFRFPYHRCLHHDFRGEGQCSQGNVRITGVTLAKREELTKRANTSLKSSVRETGSQDRFSFHRQKWTDLSLKKERDRVLYFSEHPPILYPKILISCLCLFAFLQPLHIITRS
jgi:hypothetical protein